MSYNFNNSGTQYLSSIYNFSAKITSYDANTKIATLDTPVDISLGYNDWAGIVTSQYNIFGQSVNIAEAIQNGNTIPYLSTDEAGNFVGIFNVPSTTFQTGQRVFRIDNRTVPSDPTTATTYAEATFTASGLSTSSQQLNFSPSVDSAASTFTQVSQLSSTQVSTITTYTPWDPIAQSFIVSKDNYPNGLFIKSVKIFFATKPSTNIPVTLSIVGTLNGYPNGQVLDYSTVTLDASQVVTSSSPHYLDPTTYTEFVFQAPVYIQPGTLYALMLKANSPDYTVYLAQQNSTAIASTAKALPTDPTPTTITKIGAAPYVGALFESQNSITWTADQTKDLMFVIDQCIFDTSVQGAVQFGVPQGLPYRKMLLNDIQHKLDANSLSNLYGNFSNDQLVDAINLTTTDFVPTKTSINYEYLTTLYNGNAIDGPYFVVPGAFASPTPENIHLNDGKGERILLSSVPNSFSLTATLSSTDPNVSPIISDDGVSLYNVRYIINNMGLSNNVISVANTGTGYHVNTTSIIVSNPDVGSDIALLAPVIDANGNVISAYVTYSGSGYLTTPTASVVDSNTTPGTGTSIIIHGEDQSFGGNGIAKYFTKKVVLTPGSDSGDLRVYYTAYKPQGTEVYIYYKILSRTDTQNFDDGYWQLMTQITNTNTYSSTRNDLIEYEWAPGMNNVANNQLSYVSTNGQTYNNFSQFAIKVVMATNDRTNVPFLTDIRALALPSGTGL